MAVALAFAWVLVPGCGEKQNRKAAAAPAKGVVGKILSLRGTVNYSLTPKGERKPLTPGMELRAEWTVHTGPESELSARLSNGHRWTLSADLSKRVSKIAALTLAPVKEGAVAQLSNLRTHDGKDRSAAAGLHQERTAAAKAAPSSTPRGSDGADLDEVAPPTAIRPAPSGRVASKKRMRERTRTSSSGRTRNRSSRRRPKKRSSIAGLLGIRGGGGSSLGGKLTRSPTPVRSPRPASPPKPTVRRDPAPKDAESRPRKLTPGQINRVIRPLKSQLVGCLKTHKVKTALSLLLVIRGATGRVTSARVSGRASGDAVVRCLRRRARSLHFARFSAATQTTHPIRLKAP